MFKRGLVSLFATLGVAACAATPPEENGLADLDWEPDAVDNLRPADICVDCGDEDGPFVEPCTSVCSTGGSCSVVCTAPNNTMTTCGGYGVCQSCASTCTATTACNTSCKSGSGVTTCGGYGTCKLCSYTACRNGNSTGMSSECTMDCQNGAGGPIVDCNDWGYGVKGDADLDQIPDAFEATLAAKFSPRLALSSNTVGGCTGGDRAQFYGARPESDTNLPYVVRRVGTQAPGLCASGECIEIIYGLPFNADLGDPETGWTEHLGDTEFYAALIAHKSQSASVIWGTSSFATALTSADNWRAIQHFAGAHWCSSSFLCIWGPDSSSFLTEPPEGRTLRRDLFVAEGKHGMYFSVGACDGGGCDFSDNCGTPSTTSWHWVATNPIAGAVNKLQNVGDRYCHEHFDTTIANATTVGCSYPPSGSHDVWSGQAFGCDTGYEWNKKFKPNLIEWGDHDYTCQ